MTTVEVVKKYWSLMQSNDFQSVGQVLSDDFVLEWPQSGERIRGRENFGDNEVPSARSVAIHDKPAHYDDVRAVTDVSLTDGVQVARAISFFSIADGRIKKMIEFWPDPFPAEENRTHLVEVMDT
jgi:ketosteroid isomerase-like protein